MENRNPLSWGDIGEWERLTKKNLTAWEVSVLRTMDRAYLEVANEMSKVK